MNKKIFALLGVCVLLTANAYAQRPLKMAKQVTDAMTGAVPSAFSSAAPVSFVGGELVGRQIAKAQFAATNPVYVSSANLFKRVQQAQGVEQISLKNQLNLTDKFNRLDVAVKTSAYKQTSYLGALWNMDPVTDPTILAVPNVKAMTDLLDVQRYMQTHDGVFPQLFSIGQDGFLRVAEGLESQAGSQAFMGMLSILIKQQQGLISPVIAEHLANLRAHARNQVDVDLLVAQLENWRLANENPTGAPQLPNSMEGVSLRNNAEALWLATEIRLLQLMPDMELPEVLKTAQVTR